MQNNLSKSNNKNMLLGDLLSFGLILAFSLPKQSEALKCKVQRYDSRNGHIYMDASGQQNCIWDLQPPENRSDIVVIALRILTFYNKPGYSTGEITLLDGTEFNADTSPDNFLCETYMKVNSSCGKKTSVEKICGKSPMTSLEWPPVLQATLDDYTFTATYTFYACNETISNAMISETSAKPEVASSSTPTDEASPNTTMTSPMGTIKPSTTKVTSKTTKPGVVCKPEKVSDLTSVTTFWIAIVLAIVLLIACFIILALLIKNRRLAEKGQKEVSRNPPAEINAYEPEETYTMAQPNGEQQLYQTTSAEATNNDTVYSQLERK